MKHIFHTIDKNHRPIRSISLNKFALHFKTKEHSKCRNHGTSNKLKPSYPKETALLAKV
jgi:hypothetical protein